MMDIKKFLETVDKFDFAGEKKGQKPGQQWKGTDKSLPGTKLVGEELDSNVVLIQDPKGQYLDKLDLNVAAKKYNFNANDIKQQLQHQDFTQIGNIRVIKPIAAENVIKELEDYVKETSKERELKRDFDDFDSEDWAEWDAKIKRLKQRAKQGELVTVWDKEKRVYKNVPKSEIKEYQNRMDPDAQVTSPPSPDASQTAIDQVQDKIFARDVEDETVEEQTTNPYTGADAKKFGQMSKADQQWYTQGNKKPDVNDPYIAMRAPNKGQPAKTTPAPIKAPAVAGRPISPSTTSTAVNTKNIKGTNLPPLSTQTAQTKVRPTVVDQPRTVKADPNAFKKVPQQTIKVDTAATATSAPAAPTVQQPAKPSRTTWRSLAKLNPQIKNPDRIYPGQEITLPNGTKAIVSKGDTLSGIAQRYRLGGYADGTPVKTAPATAAATPVKPQPDVKGKELPKASGKAASQLQKGREYRAIQTPNTAGGMVKTMGEVPRASKKGMGTDSGYVQDLSQNTKDKGPTNAQLKQQLMGAESGGRNIRNIAGSSAFGQFQITRNTFRNAQNQLPDGHPAKDLSWKDFQKDTTAQGMVMDQLLNDYRNSLSVLKQPVTPRNIYALHHFGAPNARELFKADPNAKLSSLGAQWSDPKGNIYKQNPVDPNQTVGQALKYLQKRMDIFDPNKGGRKLTTESLMADYRKFVAEYGNQQAPDQQATSQDSAESDAEAELKRQRMDRRVSQATLAGLSAVLPPGTNTAVAATALNKIVDQKPLSPQENQVIGTLMPLLARAAEEPSTSASLKTALGRAGMLTKLGKQ